VQFLHLTTSLLLSSKRVRAPHSDTMCAQRSCRLKLTFHAFNVPIRLVPARRTMKKSPFSKPIAPAPATDAASAVSNNMLSARPDWDELLRSLSPSSPTSPDAMPDAGTTQVQSPSPAAADRWQRDRSQHSRAAAAAHNRGQLAILLPEEAHLFVGMCSKGTTSVE
jgi:hypothetical protein